MFDIGWSELVVIGVVALIVIGPKELPGMLRTIGGAIAKVRRMAGEFQSQFNEAMREAELDEARKAVDGVSQSANFNPIQTIRDEIQKAVETPVSKPAPGTDVKLDIPDPPPIPDLTPEQMQAAFEPVPAPPAAVEPPAVAPAVETAAPTAEPSVTFLRPGEAPPAVPPRRPTDTESAAG
jgi:sec-independent protein translocase protein TatB